MNGAEAVVRFLERVGVEQTFGVGGESVLHLMEAMRTSDVDYITTRHEQAAALAEADGYARTALAPAVCLAHVGAGVSNLVNGLADAYKDDVPVVAIGGNVKTDKLGRDAWHEIDHLGMVEPVTKWRGRLDRPDRIPQVMREAMARLVTGVPGPIYLDLPKDVAEAELSPETEAAVESALAATPTFGPAYNRTAPTAEAVEEVAERVRAADTPIVLAGVEALWADAGASLEALCDDADLPVLTSMVARGLVSETHPSCFGVLGLFGRLTAKRVADDADLVVSVGCKLADNETFEWTQFEDTDVVQVNLGEGHLGRQFDVAQAIRADSHAFVDALVEALGDTNPANERIDAYREAFEEELDWVERRDEPVDVEPGLVDPREFVSAMKRHLGPEDVITSGAGGHSLWANLVPTERPATHHKSAGLGTMGFGFPAGIGAQVAAPDANVVAVVGDGDFSMVCQEVWTAAQEGIPLVVAVLNDRQHSAIKNPQAKLYGGEPFGVEFTDADFAAVAEGFGATGIRVTDEDDPDEVLASALDADGPVVLDVLIDPEVDAPALFYEYQI